ncbi:MAG: DUF11 domain-containing protein, partial [Lysobacter sp.]|nr:DUF11 domain-containing protein [Lysobacter sp.]
WTCTAGTLTGNSLVLANGDTASCTITNDDQAASLTLLKTVVNDNGGTALDTAWTLTATGPTTGVTGTEGQATVTNAAVAAGTYTLTEAGGPAGYTAGAWTCTAGTLTGNSLVLANGDTASCTITNDDQTASLTLLKTVVNDNGGTALDTAWTLTATGPTTGVTGTEGQAAVTNAAVAAGTYTLSEAGGPAGYTAGAWTCTAGTLTGNSLVLANGDTASCTITNDDQAASLILVKRVVGGTADAAAFGISTSAGALTFGANSGSPENRVYTSNTLSVSAGTYTLVESDIALYTEGAWSCTGTGASGVIGAFDAGSVTLANGASVTCEITNTALPEITSSKSSTPATGTTVTPGDTITYTLSTTVGTAALTAVYTLTDTLSGDQTFGTVTNAGSYTCTGTGPLVCTLPAGTLPGTYTLSYTTTVDADASGTVGNSVSGTGGGDPDPECTDCTTTHPVALPEITSSKSSTPATGTTVTPGDTITYTLSTTVGTAALTAVYTLTDTLSGDQTFGTVTNAGSYTCTGTGPLVCTLPAGTLPGTYTLSYTTTVDADASGTVGNSVSGTGGGDPDPECTDCTTTHDVLVDPSLTIVKTAGAPSTNLGANPAVTDAGDTIAYSFVITNTGNVGLTGVVVNDAQLDAAAVCDRTTLAPNEVANCTGTHTIRQDEVNAGKSDNSATASGTPPSGNPVTSQPSTTSTPIATTPALSSVKTMTANADEDGNGAVSVGDTLTYTVTVTNTGNVSLTDVVVTDNKITPASITCATVDPAANCVLTGTYRVTQADADAGRVLNTAVVTTATPNVCPPGSTAPECNPTVTVPVTQQPALTSVKAMTANADEDGNGAVSVGDTLTYTVTVTNTGNVSLTNVVVTDNKITPSSITCASVAPTATCVLTGTYRVTQADARAGQVVNAAVVTTPEACPAGSTAPECNPTVTVPVNQQPALTSVKAMSANADEDGDGAVSVGDTLTYTVTVTNTGNVTLTGVVVTDNKITPNTITCATVDPAATCVLTGTYRVTQADAEAGQVLNTAVVTTNTPNACPPGSTAPECNPTVTVPVKQEPKLSSVKAMTANADEDGNGAISVGDTLTYTVTVTNTGNVSLADVVVTDNKITPNSVTCATLAPAATCVLTGTYRVTQADAEAGQVLNAAVIATTTPGVCPAGSTAPECNPTVTVNVIGRPAIAATKTATLTTDLGTPGKGNAGDVITYSVTVTNTGDVTLTDLKTLDTFENGTPTTLTCAPTTLAPGATATCNSYTHTITEAEANAGGTLDNVILASGVYGTTTQTVTVTATSTAVVTVEPEPTALRVSKQANPRDVKVGDLVRYTVTIENLGQAAASDVTMIDTPPAGFSYVDGSLRVADGDNAGRLVGTFPVRVDQIDIEAGGRATVVYLLRVGAGVRPGVHVNRAYAEDGGVRSNVATAEVQLVADPLLDESLILGTVFDDRDEDGWQDPAELSGIRVQGGFAAGAYVANSTTVDRGNGAAPEPDASSPMLHGIELGKIAGRQSDADPVAAHTVVISQKLSALEFTDDFAMTTAQGLTLRMDREGNSRVERSGDAGKGLTGADPKVERRVAQVEGGYQVDYVVSNAGVDERGIPGVRLATVEGLLIETDQFGRYHLEGVPGGAWERGRNFIVKVDPATLPPGSQLTTDNPLVRRITPGVPVRFDFGVKLPPGEMPGGKEEVEMRIGEVFFAPGSAAVTPQYLPAVEKMAEKVREYGGGEVVIVAQGEYETLAMDRALAVRKALEATLTAEQLKALTVSVRTQADFPGSMVVGFSEWPLLGEVLFDTDRSTIKAKYQPLIAKMAAAIEQMRATRIVITGHTDKRASDDYNVALGMRRAKAVYDAIAEKISPELRAKFRVDLSNDPAAPAGNEK